MAKNLIPILAILGGGVLWYYGQEDSIDYSLKQCLGVGLVGIGAGIVINNALSSNLLSKD